MSLSKIPVNSPVAKQIADALGTTPQKLDQWDNKPEKEDGFINFSKIAMNVSVKETGYYRRAGAQLLLQKKHYGFEGTIYCQGSSPDPYQNTAACFVQKENGKPALLVYETQTPKREIKIFDADKLDIFWQLRALFQNSELPSPTKKYLSDSLKPERKLEIELGAALLGGFASDIKLFRDWVNAQVAEMERQARENQTPQTGHADQRFGPYNRGPAGGDAAEPLRTVPVPFPR